MADKKALATAAKGRLASLAGGATGKPTIIGGGATAGAIGASSPKPVNSPYTNMVAGGKFGATGPISKSGPGPASNATKNAGKAIPRTGGPNGPFQASTNGNSRGTSGTGPVKN